MIKMFTREIERWNRSCINPLRRTHKGDTGLSDPKSYIGLINCLKELKDIKCDKSLSSDDREYLNDIENAVVSLMISDASMVRNVEDSNCLDRKISGIVENEDKLKDINAVAGGIYFINDIETYMICINDKKDSFIFEPYKSGKLTMDLDYAKIDRFLMDYTIVATQRFGKTVGDKRLYSTSQMEFLASSLCDVIEFIISLRFTPKLIIDTALAMYSFLIVAFDVYDQMMVEGNYDRKLSRNPAINFKFRHYDRLVMYFTVYNSVSDKVQELLGITEEDINRILE